MPEAQETGEVGKKNAGKTGFDAVKTMTMKQMWKSPAARVVMIYAGAALLWILFSDYLLGQFSGSPHQLTVLSAVKGAFFVLVTSLLLLVVLERRFRTESEARAAAEETARQLKDIQTIAEHGGEILYSRTVDGHFTYVSPQYRTLLGYGPEDVEKGWTQVLTENPINRAAFESAERAIQTGGRQVPCLVELRKKNGDTLLMEVDASPLKDSSGKVTAIVGAARDVTQRETAQRALRQSEQRFRRLAETISEVFWMANPDLSQIHYISPAYEQIWGRSCESLYQNPKAWAEAVHPDDRERVWRLLGVELGKEASVEYRIVRPDGAIRWILDRAFPRRNDNGELIEVVGLAKDITERRITEQALRDSEEKLRTLYSSMNEGLALHEMVYDASGHAADYRIVDVNPAFEAITGLSRARLVGQLASAAFGTGAPLWLDAYAPVAASGTPSAFETQLPASDKHVMVSVFSPRKGQFATVFADITKRKEAEHQICLLNQVYALISHINEAIVRISDRDTLFRETCRIATDDGQFRMAWVGLLDEATGVVQPVAWAGDEDGYVAQLQARADSGPRGSGPSGSAVREGRVVVCADIERDPQMAPWREAALARGYRSSIALPLKTGGKVTGVLAVYADEPNFFNVKVTESLIEVAADLSFALDIFERNRQREVEQRQLRLQHSALEAAANAIVITNREGVIQWVNEAFTRLTGYQREEAIGANPRLLKSGAHDEEFYRQMWKTVLAGSVWQGELTNKRKDGVLYHEEMTITPVRSDAGEITHFIAIKQDVTERRKLEQQFLRAQRMQSIGLLAGGVAHDLNNVMAPVLMALPLLRGGLPAEQRDHILDTLERSIQRGANIVQQVLTFARGVEVQRVRVQPRHLIREIAKIAEETFPRDIDTRATVPGNLWPVSGDPTQIHQVLLNLAVNARDAMPDGGQLTFSARNVELGEPLQFMDFEIPPGRYTSLSVTDTGTGIAPDTLERMFEPFFTTKPAGKGTGLGLSTVLGIVKSHGGLVEVQTKPGAGSTFKVFLPAVPPEAAPAAAPLRPILPQGHGETIMLVDDEAAVLQLTRSILLANGYKVVTAKEGMQALARFTQSGQTISAVITDLMMPFMDGLTLTRALRDLNSSVPVVATTGLMNPPGEPDRAAQLRELGVKHFLAKPFQADTLLTTLHNALHGNGSGQGET